MLSTSRDRRYLIVNADDFGCSAGINRGIAQAHERGIVTSASLMVRFDASAEAARFAREHVDLGVGLHVDLGEWAYTGGEWRQTYEVVPTDDAVAVARETVRQLDLFRQLVGRNPTHLDSHQHVHLDEPVRSALVTLAAELGVPVRHLDAEVRYCGEFYGQARDGSPLPELIGVEALIGILARLEPGFTELGCHVGDDPALDSPYRLERMEELRTLCDPRVRGALLAEGVELRTFHDLARLPLPAPSSGTA